MHERLAQIRDNWRLGPAIGLLSCGVWFELAALNQAGKGNFEIGGKTAVAGALQLGVGLLTYWNHNRHIQRISETQGETISELPQEEGPMLELQESQTFSLEAPEANP